jgi:hypothetical protein
VRAGVGKIRLDHWDDGHRYRSNSRDDVFNLQLRSANYGVVYAPRQTSSYLNETCAAKPIEWGRIRGGLPEDLRVLDGDVTGILDRVQ